jgi:hypothetical protein
MNNISVTKVKGQLKKLEVKAQVEVKIKIWIDAMRNMLCAEGSVYFVRGQIILDVKFQE